MVFAVGERLGWSHYYTFAGVNSERIEILHITHGDAIVVTVAYHLVFHFFPAL